MDRDTELWLRGILSWWVAAGLGALTGMVVILAVLVARLIV